ncbi:disulfide bond formation protein B [Candidatus Pelagibacter bacterium]|nr:disulfide bond formation protein B [Candidatus Pelagibacter bacterium]|tara:strand:- start:119 stop:604 length:486 start_codon:yes stop_codon:yes gene_type:complete
MLEIKNKKFLYLILIFCIFALTAAYFIQYVLGHQPCKLCLIERLPFVAVVIIILFCLIYKKFEKISLFIISLIFFSLAILSFYHFGIEQGFIKESLVCDLNTVDGTLTKEEVLNQLKKQVVSCKDVTFKIFGLSLATINVFVSLTIGIITLKIFLNYGKNK